jgi:hypothetical protein
MKIKKMECLLGEMKKMEMEGMALNFNWKLKEEKEDLLGKVSEIYGVDLEEIKTEYEEIEIV